MAMMEGDWGVCRAREDDEEVSDMFVDAELDRAGMEVLSTEVL